MSGETPNLLLIFCCSAALRSSPPTTRHLTPRDMTRLPPSYRRTAYCSPSGRADSSLFMLRNRWYKNDAASAINATAMSAPMR
ncbi:hypothetical protein DES53_105242 [Roseimicrobium gellanilyticum]|uniref:Uncharacterized protein n=1 Tax=Roseimicrobium gellanilyticum TaxID=748857 RepID=A0A366HLP0_9BACT|nr:hypothetical protein DES53_105242 [Roseimicrobium gellanilyticum]